MHGLLAVSALHLSTLQPSRKSELVRFASTSESLALPTFRELVKRNDPGDISAVFAFAGSVIPYMLAVSGVLGVSDMGSPCAKEPHWFLMARGLIDYCERTGRLWRRGRLHWCWSPLSFPLRRAGILMIAFGESAEGLGGRDKEEWSGG